MSRQFNFKTQSNVGNIGEKFFLQCYKKRGAVQTDGRIHDFIVDGNKTVELKTDTYPMAKTPNFFMEKFGNIDKQALGGPWRAEHDKIDFFVYLFLNEKTFFWFSPKDLVALINPIIVDMKPKIIDNKTWAALGYTVARELCRPVCLIEEKF